MAQTKEQKRAKQKEWEEKNKAKRAEYFQNYRDTHKKNEEEITTLN